jgi:hypothetical protein
LLDERCRGVLWENMSERNHLEDLGVDGRVILKWVLKKQGGAWTRLIWVRIGQVMGCCKCGNEPSSSIKCGEFIDWLRNC